MVAQWLQLSVWTAAVLVLAWGAVLHCLVWVTFIPDESASLRDLLTSDLELKVSERGRSDLSISNHTFARIDGLSNAVEEGERTAEYWGHLSMPETSPSNSFSGTAAQQNEDMGISVGSGEAGVSEELAGRLYRVNAPAQLIAVYLVYSVPLFVAGLAGWFFYHWPVTSRKVASCQLWLRVHFLKAVPPAQWFDDYMSGLTYAELLMLVFFFVPKVLHLAWFMNGARQDWQDGVEGAYALQGITRGQFWTHRLGLWFSSDFQMHAPFLFAVAAKGSPVHSFLGISPATSKKWFRWLGRWSFIDLLFHGFLHLVLLLSAPGPRWGDLIKFSYVNGTSNIAGIMSWVAMVVLALLILCALRWKAPSVWQRVHVAAGAVVVVLGVVHARQVWVSVAPGLALYGFDVALRWLQASHTASASISASGGVLSAVVPLEDGTKYPDGCQVLLSIPSEGTVTYYPFVVASSAVDHAWHGCMLLQSAAAGTPAQELLETARLGKLHNATVRVQGPFGGGVLGPVALDSIQHLLVFTEGQGASAVIPALLRLAQHGQHGFSLPERQRTVVHVYHCARSLEDLAACAPLLDHPAIFQVHIHYAGTLDAFSFQPVPLPTPEIIRELALAEEQKLPEPSTEHAQKTDRRLSSAQRDAMQTDVHMHMHASQVATGVHIESEAEVAAEASNAAVAANRTQSAFHVGDNQDASQLEESAMSVGFPDQDLSRMGRMRGSAAAESPPSPLTRMDRMRGGGDDSPPQRPEASGTPAPLPPLNTRPSLFPISPHRSKTGSQTASPHARTSAVPYAQSTVAKLEGAVKAGNSSSSRGSKAGRPMQVWDAASAEEGGLRRLAVLPGKWEGLMVWVGCWAANFWTLVLGEIWYNSSLLAQAGLLDDDEEDSRRLRMAAYNILALVLTCPTIPLILLLLTDSPLPCGARGSGCGATRGSSRRIARCNSAAGAGAGAGAVNSHVNSLQSPQNRGGLDHDSRALTAIPGSNNMLVVVPNLALAMHVEHAWQDGEEGAMTNVSHPRHGRRPPRSFTLDIDTPGMSASLQYPNNILIQKQGTSELYRLVRVGGHEVACQADSKMRMSSYITRMSTASEMSLATPISQRNPSSNFAEKFTSSARTMTSSPDTFSKVFLPPRHVYNEFLVSGYDKLKGFFDVRPSEDLHDIQEGSREDGSTTYRTMNTVRAFLECGEFGQGVPDVNSRWEHGSELVAGKRRQGPMRRRDLQAQGGYDDTRLDSTGSWGGYAVGGEWGASGIENQNSLQTVATGANLHARAGQHRAMHGRVALAAITTAPAAVHAMHDENDREPSSSIHTLDSTMHDGTSDIRMHGASALAAVGADSSGPRSQEHMQSEDTPPEMHSMHAMHASLSSLQHVAENPTTGSPKSSPKSPHNFQTSQKAPPGIPKPPKGGAKPPSAPKASGLASAIERAVSDFSSAEHTPQDTPTSRNPSHPTSLRSTGSRDSANTPTAAERIPEGSEDLPEASEDTARYQGPVIGSSAGDEPLTATWRGPRSGVEAILCSPISARVSLQRQAFEPHALEGQVIQEEDTEHTASHDSCGEDTKALEAAEADEEPSELPWGPPWALGDLDLPPRGGLRSPQRPGSPPARGSRFLKPSRQLSAASEEGNGGDDSGDGDAATLFGAAERRKTRKAGGAVRGERTVSESVRIARAARTAFLGRGRMRGTTMREALAGRRAPGTSMREALDRINAGSGPSSHASASGLGAEGAIAHMHGNDQEGNTAAPQEVSPHAHDAADTDILEDSVEASSQSPDMHAVGEGYEVLTPEMEICMHEADVLRRTHPEQKRRREAQPLGEGNEAHTHEQQQGEIHQFVLPYRRIPGPHTMRAGHASANSTTAATRAQHCENRETQQHTSTGNAGIAALSSGVGGNRNLLLRMHGTLSGSSARALPDMPTSESQIPAVNSHHVSATLSDVPAEDDYAAAILAHQRSFRRPSFERNLPNSPPTQRLSNPPEQATSAVGSPHAYSRRYAWLGALPHSLEHYLKAPEHSDAEYSEEHSEDHSAAAAYEASLQMRPRSTGSTPTAPSFLVPSFSVGGPSHVQNSRDFTGEGVNTHVKTHPAVPVDSRSKNSRGIGSHVEGSSAAAFPPTRSSKGGFRGGDVPRPQSGPPVFEPRVSQPPRGGAARLLPPASAISAAAELESIPTVSDSGGSLVAGTAAVHIGKSTVVSATRLRSSHREQSDRASLRKTTRRTLCTPWSFSVTRLLSPRAVAEGQTAEDAESSMSGSVVATGSQEELRAAQNIENSLTELAHSHSVPKTNSARSLVNFSPSALTDEQWEGGQSTSMGGMSPHPWGAQSTQYTHSSQFTPPWGRVTNMTNTNDAGTANTSAQSLMNISPYGSPSGAAAAAVAAAPAALYERTPVLDPWSGSRNTSQLYFPSDELALPMQSIQSATPPSVSLLSGGAVCMDAAAMHATSAAADATYMHNTYAHAQHAQHMHAGHVNAGAATHGPQASSSGNGSSGSPAMHAGLSSSSTSLRASGLGGASRATGSSSAAAATLLGAAQLVERGVASGLSREATWNSSKTVPDSSLGEDESVGGSGGLAHASSKGESLGSPVHNIPPPGGPSSAYRGLLQPSLSADSATSDHPSAAVAACKRKWLQAQPARNPIHAPAAAAQKPLRLGEAAPGAEPIRGPPLLLPEEGYYHLPSPFSPNGSSPAASPLGSSGGWGRGGGSRPPRSRHSPLSPPHRRGSGGGGNPAPEGPYSNDDKDSASSSTVEEDSIAPSGSFRAPRPRDTMGSAALDAQTPSSAPFSPAPFSPYTGSQGSSPHLSPPSAAYRNPQDSATWSERSESSAESAAESALESADGTPSEANSAGIFSEVSMTLPMPRDFPSMLQGGADRGYHTAPCLSPDHTPLSTGESNIVPDLAPPRPRSVPTRGPTRGSLLPPFHRHTTANLQRDAEQDIQLGDVAYDETPRGFAPLSPPSSAPSYGGDQPPHCDPSSHNSPPPPHPPSPLNPARDPQPPSHAVHEPLMGMHAYAAAAAAAAHAHPDALHMMSQESSLGAGGNACSGDIAAHALSSAGSHGSTISRCSEDIGQHKGDGRTHSNSSNATSSRHSSRNSSTHASTSSESSYSSEVRSSTSSNNNLNNGNDGNSSENESKSERNSFSNSFSTQSPPNPIPGTTALRSRPSMAASMEASSTASAPVGEPSSVHAYVYRRTAAAELPYASVPEKYADESRGDGVGYVTSGNRMSQDESLVHPAEGDVPAAPRPASRNLHEHNVPDTSVEASDLAEILPGGFSANQPHSLSRSLSDKLVGPAAATSAVSAAAAAAAAVPVPDHMHAPHANLDQARGSLLARHSLRTRTASRQTVSPGGVVIIHENENHASSMHGDYVGLRNEVPEEAEPTTGGPTEEVVRHHVRLDVLDPDRIVLRSSKPGSRPARVEMRWPNVRDAVARACAACSHREVLHVWVSGSQHLVTSVNVATGAAPRRTALRTFPVVRCSNR